MSYLWQRLMAVGLCFLLTGMFLASSSAPPAYAQEEEEEPPVLSTYRIYYSPGKLQMQYTYYGVWDPVLLDTRLVKHGTYQEWREDGQLWYQREYKHGLLHGIEKEWYENGQLRYQGEYKYGLVDGTSTHWAFDGLITGQAEWREDVPHGLWRTYVEGVLLKEEEYRYGVQHGRETWFYSNGQKKVEKQYKDGKSHGPYVYYYSNGQKEWLRTYVDGVLHGPYAEWHEDGKLRKKGQYSNRTESGVWTYYWYGPPWDDEEPGLVQYRDKGGVYKPAEPEQETQPEGKGISGYVRNAATGLPLVDALVKAGSYEATTDSEGFYSLTLGEPDSYGLTYSKDGFYTYSGSVNMAGSLSKTVNIRLKRKTTITEKPAITRVESLDGKVFLEGIQFFNSYVVSVDWRGEPGVVKFDANGSVYEEPGTATGARHIFDMGSIDFRGSLAPKGNILKITAVNKAGVASASETLYPRVRPVPRWSGALAPFRKKGDVKGGAGFSLGVEWPEEPVEIQINEKTLGPTPWLAWSLFPIIGGRSFGIPETQASLQVELTTDGEASVTLKGKTGFEAAGGKIEGSIGGKGTVEDQPGEGLVWKGADFLLGIAGELKKEVGPVTVIPALEGAVNLPIIGRVIGWFNSKAKIEATIGPEIELALQILDEKGNLGFHKVEGTFTVGVDLGLGLELSENIEAKVSGGGNEAATYQFPADPDYLKGFEAGLFAKLGIKVWVISKEFEASYALKYPGESQAAGYGASYPTISQAMPLVVTSRASDFHTISRDFLSYIPYNRFVANSRIDSFIAKSRTESLVSGVAAGSAQNKVVENVYPDAEPAIAESGGKVGIAFVYFDPDDPTLQATEIYFTYYDGASYTEPQPVIDDTRAEFSPAIAFDQNGKVVAVWERVKQENLTEESLLTMAQAMEIVYAVYDPATGSWSAPLSLTDNDYLDHSPILRRGADGSLLLTWQSNQGNELIGAADSPSRIHYAIWDGGSFGAVGTLAQDFANCFKFSLAYNGDKAVLAYMGDMDGDLATTEDEEIFYTSFDGSTWSDPVRVTDDQQADINPEVVYRQDGTPELVWLKGDVLVRLTDWNTGAYEVVRQGSTSFTFTDFKLASDPQNRLVLLWQDIDKKGIDLFYSVYDPDNEVWSQDLRLTEDAGMEKDFQGVFSADGTLHLAYNKENLETGANDLYHLTYGLSTDLAISAESLSIEPKNPIPGTQVSLAGHVENRGDIALKDVPVAFYLGDPESGGTSIGTALVEPSVLGAGEKGAASLLWTIPQDINVYTVYAVVDPTNTVAETNETNNTAWFPALGPDLEAIQLKLEEHGDGSLDVIALIQNSGGFPATDVEVLFEAEDKKLVLVTVPSILPGMSTEVAHTVWADVDFATSQPEIEVKVDPGNKILETREDNNQSFASLVIAPQIVASPEDHGFGDVKVGSLSAPRTFTIINTGNVNLVVGTLAITGANASEFSIQNDYCSGKTMAPSGSYTVSVVLSPVARGAKVANLTVPSNDPDTPTLDIVLSGTGLALPGDVNYDAVVDTVDLVLVAAAFNTVEGSSMWNADADLNRDGVVNIFDLAWVSLYFGASLP